MKLRSVVLSRFTAISAIAAVAIVSGRASIAQAAPPHERFFPPGAHYKPFCPAPDAQGRQCYGQILVDENDAPYTADTAPPGGWTPGELEEAYGLPAPKGLGTKIIATYIGNHYTNAEADMAVYRTKFGMSPCTKANGCFIQVTDSGGTDFSGLKDDGCSGFVGEESLDMDMLMAGCPDCKILIMEGGDHAKAIATAAKMGALSMSMSWGYGASVNDCKVYTPPAGLALFAASGDQGYTASPGAPAECTDVIAVGWTQLATDTSPRGYADTIPQGWGSAGGCSTIISKGAWQTDTGCKNRMVSDLAANGDNVAAYCTSPAGSANWHVTGGSSASSPFTSGALATLGVTSIPGFDAAWIYANAKKFWDVKTGGPVGNCPGGSPSYYCTPTTGYDGPTGVGVPYGPMLVPPPVDGGTDEDAGDDSGIDGGSASNDGGAHASDGGADASGTVHKDAGSSGPGNGSVDGGSSTSDDGSGCGCRAIGGKPAERSTGGWIALSGLALIVGARVRSRRAVKEHRRH